jgi:hypothetical protein
MTGIWVNNDFMLKTVMVEEVVELFNGSSGYGKFFIAEQAKYGTSQAAQPVEKLLHPAAIKSANGIQGTGETEHQGHTPTEAKTHTADLAVAVGVLLELIEYSLQIRRGI